MAMDEQEKGWIRNTEEARRAEEIRKKQARGETLTWEGVGMLGALASRKRTGDEHHQAEREGRGAEYHEEHRAKSWMKGEDTRLPTLSVEDRKRERELKEKEARGETLTREESGFLGGIARAREAGNE